jgi:hypothetical protein
MATTPITSKFRYNLDRAADDARGALSEIVSEYYAPPNRTPDLSRLERVKKCLMVSGFFGPTFSDSMPKFYKQDFGQLYMLLLHQSRMLGIVIRGGIFHTFLPNRRKDERVRALPEELCGEMSGHAVLAELKSLRDSAYKFKVVANGWRSMGTNTCHKKPQQNRRIVKVPTKGLWHDPYVFF